MEKENREVKSSVFADLFYEDQSAEENIISLYNALHEQNFILFIMVYKKKKRKDG